MIFKKILMTLLFSLPLFASNETKISNSDSEQSDSVKTPTKKDNEQYVINVQHEDGTQSASVMYSSSAFETPKKQTAEMTISKLSEDLIGTPSGQEIFPPSYQAFQQKTENGSKLSNLMVNNNEKDKTPSDPNSRHEPNNSPEIKPEEPKKKWYEKRPAKLVLSCIAGGVTVVGYYYFKVSKRKEVQEQ